MTNHHGASSDLGVRGEVAGGVRFLVSFPPPPIAATAQLGSRSIRQLAPPDLQILDPVPILVTGEGANAPTSR